jgi:GNAT superfamily N-acetyltransferase
VTIRVAELGSARPDKLLALMREVYGRAPSEAEFDWLLHRNPVGDGTVSVAEDDGRLAGMVAIVPTRAIVEGAETPVAFAVHGVTHPAVRGQGIFSRLMLRNEGRAAEEGATLALGFANPLAGPILVGNLGWRDLYRMRIWARPLRPLRAFRRAGGGGLPPPRGARLERFDVAHERAWRAVQPRWGNCLVRDAMYLNWRYLEAPRDYRAFASANGYAVVGHAVHKGVSAAVVCDLVGPRQELRPLLRSCLREARGGADAAIAVPAPGQRAAYLSLGFLPTPKTIRVIGKPLRPGAAVSPDWHFSLGDTDFF